MRTSILLLASVLFLAACHKDDVDIATLTTNPMDADYSGQAVLMEVDTVHTEVTVWSIHEQHVTVRVHPGHFPSPAPYEVWCIEENVPDTIKGYSSQHPDNRFELENYQVALGTEYCYRIQLRVADVVIREERVCAIAQL
ncbi:MAG TPA: hypothetical protein VGE21_16035 [Flavobacteriales bacterium]